MMTDDDRIQDGLKKNENPYTIYTQNHRIDKKKVEGGGKKKKERRERESGFSRAYKLTLCLK